MKRNTRTITLRIDASLEEVLSRDAKGKGLTVNSLANQIFKSYSEWDRYSDGLCMMPISRDILQMIFDQLSEEEASIAGEKAGRFVSRELTSFLFGGFNKQSLVRFLELWFSRFASHEHKITDTAHLFVVHHDININFSRFLESFLKTALKEAGCRDIKTSPSPNSITLSFNMLD